MVGKREEEQILSQPFSPQPSAPFPFHAAQGNLCSITGRDRALSPGQDEGGDNQSLMHSATADPLGMTHPNTTHTGPQGWCWKLFLLPAEITGRKHPLRGEDLAEQLCCDYLQGMEAMACDCLHGKGHGQSRTQEGGI